MLLQRLTGQPLNAVALEHLVAASDGLSGAHLREACAAATLAWLDEGSDFPSALEQELRYLRNQHTAADRLERELRGDQAMGFR